MHWLVVAGISAFSIATLTAQNPSGTIMGKLIDAVGQRVSGVPVEARNTGTGAIYKATSSLTGAYIFRKLPPGTSEISVGIAGFERKNALLGEADTTSVDLHLIEEGIGLSLDFHFARCAKGQ